MASTTDTVRIHYHRPPDREQIYVQRFVHRTAGCTITFVESIPLSHPMRIGGDVVLEADSPIVWFTFDGAWHDIGRFHRAGGSFTGCYANVLTPVIMTGDRWDTTDLFLDVWLPLDGAPVLLDEIELDVAAAQGVLDADTARRARAEADALLHAAARGSWPPPVVAEWTLDRVRAWLSEHGGTRPHPPV